MNEQFVSLLVMFVSGVIFAAIIDAFRVIISQISPKNIIRKLNAAIEIIIWLLLSIATFYLLYVVKGGAWRFVDSFSQLLGIFSYELLFQKVFRAIGYVFYRVVLLPIYFIGRFFVQVIKVIFKIIGKAIMPFVIIIKKLAKKLSISKR